MKKHIIWLSFIGVGILFFSTGIEVFLKKKSFDFWMRFFGVAIGLLIILCVVPFIIIDIIGTPSVSSNISFFNTVGLLAVVYLYGAGVFICKKLLSLHDSN